MNIAGLRAKVTFQRNELTTDEYGNHRNTWTDFFTCWATVGSQRGSESDGEVITPTESLVFTCRWCSELDSVTSTAYRIVCDGRVYDIVYVNPMGFRHNSIKFTCSLQKGGGS